MEASRPLGYESLKTVLQYMEANLRFKLANSIPSIASTEKTVPLKIAKLQFEPYEFIVNETSYKLRTYRDYPPEVEALRNHLDANSEGGVPYDLDQYGFTDITHNKMINPGDLVIKDEVLGTRRALTEESESGFEDRLRIFENGMAERMGQVVEPLDRNHPDHFLNQYIESSDTEQIEMEIDQLKSILAPFYCRRNNTAPPYSTKVQLIVMNPNEEKVILREPGDTKLYEVQKKLATRMFGNRKTPIYVKHFEIGFGSNTPAEMTVRLPPDFQIKVRAMYILRNASAVCDAIQPFVHRSSYPLEQFKILNNSFYSALHPTICNAKKLIFCGKSQFEGGITEFLQFQNNQIRMVRNQFTPDEHIALLRNWIENRREVGTSFISKIEEKETVISILVKCKERLNGSDAGERFVKVPMSESSEINVSYKFLKKRGDQTARWMLFIKVVSV